VSLFFLKITELAGCLIVRDYDTEFKQLMNSAHVNFRIRSQSVSGFYLPFQFGVRLLRKASIPSRKSSLI
jgi:hypothetical protein